MRQDQIVSDLAALGIQGCQDSDQALHRRNFTRIPDLGIRRRGCQDQSQDYEDTLEIHACESFGCS